MSALISSCALFFAALLVHGAESRCDSHEVPKDSRCSGCPPMLNGKLCASTTRYNDQTKAACGCGQSDPVPSNWWTLTQFTAALNTASLNPVDPLLGWCPSGCGSCYELCTTGGTTQGQPTTPGICRTFKITNRCADGYGAFQEWCSNSISWEACQADPSACAQEGSTNKFGYPAHFDLQDFHGQIQNFSWDNVEVTFEPVSCRRWSGPEWDCECAAGGCSECTSTTDTPPTQCASWCSQNSNSWSTKCTWSDCLGCFNCVSPSTTASLCAAEDEDCRQSKCCQDPTTQCYEKDSYWGSCRASCEPGAINPKDPVDFQTPWTCVSLSRSAATTSTAAAVSDCSGLSQDCRTTKCCSVPTFRCYQKNEWWAECKASCTPGIDLTDAPQHQTPWSCQDLSTGTTSTTKAASPVCSGLVEDCRDTKCCSNSDFTCFEKDQWWAECKASCTPGIDTTDAPQHRTPWSCQDLSSRTSSTTTVVSLVCSGLVQDCRSTKCCTNPEFTCFRKDQWWAECKASCTPGIDLSDAPHQRTPWSCEDLSSKTSSTTTGLPRFCSGLTENCQATKCCTRPDFKCYEKDQWWAQCKTSCTPGIDLTDAPQHRTPWSCQHLSGGSTSTTTVVSPVCSGLVENCHTTKCCANPDFTCFEKDQWWAECKASCTPGLWTCQSLSAGVSSTTPVAVPTCSGIGENCHSTRCCASPDFMCFEKDQWWAQCKASCNPGIDLTDAPEFRTPWSCTILQHDGASTRLLQRKLGTSKAQKDAFLI